MPCVSLVICLHHERELLERLLVSASGCYDDLVVVHDGQEGPGNAHAESIRDLVTRYGGRFFERPRYFQQEPHWPFAWGQARYEWVLRLDADEVINLDMRDWLNAFRTSPEPAVGISGYTCSWPLWDGSRQRTKIWPAGRVWLFRKSNVRTFGMAEQTPIADDRFDPLPLTLDHRPLRKSYGLANILVRCQAWRWRQMIAEALQGKPTDLACWRWTNETWPTVWEDIRRRPWRTAFYRLLIWPLFGLRGQWRVERRLILAAALSSGINHFLICLTYWRISQRRKSAE